MGVHEGFLEALREFLFSEPTSPGTVPAVITPSPNRWPEANNAATPARKNSNTNLPDLDCSTIFPIVGMMDGVERHGTARYGGVSESWPYGGRSVSVVTAEHTNGQATAGINTGNSSVECPQING